MLDLEEKMEKLLAESSIAALQTRKVRSGEYKYMLLHRCKGYIRFTSIEPEGRSPEGVVLVNRIFPVQGCNNEFISSQSHTRYLCT